jgi:hypothetical protein
MKSSKYQRRTRKIKLRKLNHFHSFSQEHVVCFFLEMLNTIKLYHWKTYSYATHKATDELYGSLSSKVDRFVEIMIGITSKRSNLISKHAIKLDDMSSVEQFRKRIEYYKHCLSHQLKFPTSTDLLNIRDDMLGDLNQFLYLYSFK